MDRRRMMLQEPKTSREILFGAFTNGQTAIKLTTSSSYPSYVPFVYRQNTNARATTETPFPNANRYTFTVTDSSKYNIGVMDVTDMTELSIPNVSAAINGKGYRSGSKVYAWATTDSVTTPYGWIALKKMDGTAFTEEELANGAEAVFTYTEV